MYALTFIKEEEEEWKAGPVSHHQTRDRFLKHVKAAAQAKREQLLFTLFILKNINLSKIFSPVKNLCSV